MERSRNISDVLQTHGLTKHFGPVRAVDGVDLVVRRGEVFGFLGPNGSGKTTTIGMLLGLIHPTAGEAELFGEVVSPEPRIEMLLLIWGSAGEQPRG